MLQVCVPEIGQHCLKEEQGKMKKKTEQCSKKKKTFFKRKNQQEYCKFVCLKLAAMVKKKEKKSEQC